MAAASACPRPMHVVAGPWRPSRRSSSFSSVAVMRAPVAPSGWPSEMPPPFGFTSSARSSSPASRRNWSATEANASFTSITAMSSQPSPARAKARSDACGFPCSINRGSTPTRPNETNRARGFSPSREQAASLAIRTAADPSQIWLEFPAVTTPPSTNAGSRPASASSDVSARGVSSTSKSIPTRGLKTSIDTTSSSKRPSSIADSARRCDSYEYASSSSRENPHCSAISSAEIPCGTISQRSVSFSERSPPLEPIGTRDIDSTPAETTRSSCPAATAAAALKLPCIDEPHCRSTVDPQTDSGQPATSGAIRPMFQPCSPTCETQPIWTSWISAGSSLWRSTSRFSTCPARSSARIFESDPFRLPIGERIASTISASRMDDSLGTAGPVAVGAHVSHFVEPPGSRHSLQLVLAALLELHAGPGDEVLHRLRDEHLAARREGGDPGADHDGKARHLVLVQLALAGVHAGPHLKPELVHSVDDRVRAADRPRRPVEGGEEPITCGVLFFASVARQLASHERVMALEQLAPGTVAELGGAVRGADDVGEEHRGEHAVRHLWRRLAAHEALDLLRDLGREEDAPVVLAGHAQRVRSRDVPRYLAGIVLTEPVPIKDEGRHPDRREHMTNVGFGPGPVESHRHRRRGTKTEPVREPETILVALEERWARHCEELVAVLLRAPALAQLGELTFRVFLQPFGVRRGMKERDRAGPFR